MRLQLILKLAIVALVFFVIGLGESHALAEDTNGWLITTDTLVYTDTDNVQVVSPQISIHRSTDDDASSMTARIVIDAVSAASVDVVSQATTRFSETRSEVDLSVSQVLGSLLPTFSYRYSHEPDYDSHGFGVAVQREIGSSDTTLSAGYNLSLDTVGYTGTPDSGFSKSLHSHGLSLSLTQVISPETLVRGIYTMSLQQGYMEKPYRFVPLFEQSAIDEAKRDGVKINLSNFDQYRNSARVAEQVPFQRFGQAFGVRALHYVDSLPGALHLDYQFYIDSWGGKAHTLEPAIHWKQSDTLTVVGYARLYFQQAASFWQREYIAGPMEIPNNRTMDRDLSDYSVYTLAGRLKQTWGAKSAYLEISGMETVYNNYIFLDSRFALVSQIGFRLSL